MFDEDGLSAEIKFAVSATYSAFTKAWGDLQSEKLDWVSTWASVLSEFDLKTIGHATEFCVQTLPQAPSLFEFRTYCRRIVNRERLTDPIVSKVEKIAREILGELSSKTQDPNYSEISDALLVAAAIAYEKANRSVNLNLSEKYRSLEFTGRARMFVHESFIWKDQARHGKGYWVDLLGGNENA